MSSLTKKSIGAGLAIAVAATATFAASHSASSSNKAVAARHAQMQMIGYHIGVLGGIAKGEMEYDSAMVDAAAKNMRELAKMERATLWIEGTEQGAVDGSRAKASIWQDSDGFAAKFLDLQNAADAMVGAGSAEEVGSRMGALGKSCKDCHESYRGPKN
ncbi:c-type cytochrome [Sulfitobacter aestuariivivens]|uniref:Cytochrome c n=1 Tax=Sulfitobacter aestuariivivens TaxID=2766981 RepID=A0A927HD08_9RHOB|nr:cytochrome c [Sulfitobacter aestuariivivens]MBD3663157.1 cytochrome c [Sulfitobacter aestuariivivens]